MQASAVTVASQLETMSTEEAFEPRLMIARTKSASGKAWKKASKRSSQKEEASACGAASTCAVELGSGTSAAVTFIEVRVKCCACMRKLFAPDLQENVGFRGSEDLFTPEKIHEDDIVNGCAGEW